MTEPAGDSRWTPGPDDFAEVYDRYFPRVYNYIRCRVRGSEAADDIASRVFERILDKFASFKPERAPFETWLFAIVRNAVNDHFRARPGFSLDEVRERPSGERPPDSGLVEDETQRELLDALGGLDERERDILGLRFWCGQTNRAIAGLVGLSETNVGVILYRAVRKLQEKMDSHG